MGSFPEEVSQVVSLLEKHLKTPFRVYLFGSFARGDATPYSDLDLAVETLDKTLSPKEWAKLKNTVEEELKTLRKVELIYYNTAPEEFKKVIDKEKITVYEPSR
jgi:predicted nucleotidyltransferase